MNTMQTNTHPFENLRDDVRDTAHKASGAVHHVAESVTDFASDRFVKPVRKMASKASHAVTDGYETGRRAVQRQMRTTANWVADNPFTALGIGFGAGVLIGAISKLRRR
jgi:ElaB/YqjD/DUF883 family membrane-anchored ribosome-binding protein